ncbi:MAG: competence protein ComEC, partial [Erysipelothrix sp.]|nr:competence protein ComEC [Erysipelothrix sp.]
IFGFNTKRTSFLFMGDAGIDQERVLIKDHPFLKVDVLKLGHHGSKTSTSEDFLSSIQPNYGIVSAHPRAYGHPHVDVMNSLYRFRVKPLLTHDSGNIRFVSGFLFDYVLTDAFGFGIIR